MSQQMQRNPRTARFETYSEYGDDNFQIAVKRANDALAFHTAGILYARAPMPLHAQACYIAAWELDPVTYAQYAPQTQSGPVVNRLPRVRNDSYGTRQMWSAPLPEAK